MIPAIVVFIYPAIILCVGMFAFRKMSLPGKRGRGNPQATQTGSMCHGLLINYNQGSGAAWCFRRSRSNGLGNRLLGVMA